MKETFLRVSSLFRKPHRSSPERDILEWNKIPQRLDYLEPCVDGGCGIQSNAVSDNQTGLPNQLTIPMTVDLLERYPEVAMLMDSSHTKQYGKLNTSSSVLGNDEHFDDSANARKTMSWTSAATFSTDEFSIFTPYPLIEIQEEFDYGKSRPCCEMESIYSLSSGYCEGDPYTAYNLGTLAETSEGQETVYASSSIQRSSQSSISDIIGSMAIGIRINPVQAQSLSARSSISEDTIESVALRRHIGAMEDVVHKLEDPVSSNILCTGKGRFIVSPLTLVTTFTFNTDKKCHHSE